MPDAADPSRSHKGDGRPCRRGAREAAGLIEQLCEAAEAARRAITRHMAAEEAALLPALHAHLCPAQQRALVWGSLRAMPLRLLERVLPWVAGTRPGFC